MNILYVNSKKNWGGICSWTEKTALSLQKKGHYCFIVAHPDGLFAKKADKSLHIIKRRFGFDYNPVTIWFFVKFIKSKKIDIVVVNSEKEVMAGGIAAKICKIPVIRRNGFFHDFNNRFRVKLHQKYFVDRNIVPCKSMIREIKESTPWVDLSQFSVIYNGKKVLPFDEKQKKVTKKNWGVLTNSLIVGVTSQLSSVKRVDKIISVFAKIAQGKNIYLVICGSGNLFSKLKKLVSDLEIKDKVIFPGFVTNPLIVDQCYDIAISNSELEGFPNSLVEYMAAGCAVISTDVNGCGEIIENGVNGFLVESGNTKMLEEKLLKLLNDDELRIKFSMEAKKKVKEKFSEKIMVDKVEELFQKTKKR